MIDLETARKVIAAAEKKAAEIRQPMNIAVVDAGGNLVAHVRMDSAWIGSIDISINKEPPSSYGLPGCSSLEHDHAQERLKVP
jgi:uncharacterized protein GlcG (DUF336 family)